MNNTILNSYSGIKTHQFGLDSISNNIANVNTPGYREHIPEFKTLLSRNIASVNGSTVSSDSNYGVSVSSNAISTKSGDYKRSDGDFDMAYEGKGWFIVGKNSKGSLSINEDGYEGNQQNYFTRDGSFSRDSDGYLVNAAGYYVYGLDLGKIKGNVLTDNPNKEEEQKSLIKNKLTPLRIPQDMIYQPTQTTKVDIALNLNAKKENAPLAQYLFDENGKFLDQKLENLDMNALFNNEKKPLDARGNNDIRITINEEGKEKKFDFKYTPNKEVGKEEFHTFSDLKKLFQSAGLSLDVARDKDGTPIKPMAFTLKNEGADMKLTLGGKFFDSLGLLLADVPLKKGESQTSGSLNIASYSTSAEIFDEKGEKFLIKTQYFLEESGDNRQKQDQIWEARSRIMDKTDHPLDDKTYTQTLEFDTDHQAHAKPIELDFQGSKIAYSLEGAGDAHSSNLGYEDSSLLKSESDGKKEGRLSGVSIDENGIIQLNFDNGVSTPMGRIGIAAFSNDQGLHKVGGNLFELKQTTDNNGDNKILSGAPILGWDGDGDGRLKFGRVMHKYLETSNTDVTSALTNLILMQRGYSMNAKALSTGDDLIKEAINLKR